MKLLGCVAAVVIVAAFLAGDGSWLGAVYHHSMTDIRTAWEHLTT